MRSLLPWILRWGTGLYWIYVGLVPKLLFAPDRADRSVLASFGLQWLAEPTVWLALGILEIGLGVALCVGCAVRRVALAQVLLLGVGTMWAFAADPFSFTYPLGGVAANGLLVTTGLVLLVTGGGEWLSWDRARERRRPERALERSERAAAWVDACVARFYGTQATTLGDPELAGLVLRFAGEEPSRPAPRTAVLGSVFGWLTARSGVRAALRTDLELEQRRADHARRRLELAARVGQGERATRAAETWRRARSRIERFEARLGALGEGVSEVDALGDEA